jgi:hypothetical protein
MRFRCRDGPRVAARCKAHQRSQPFPNSTGSLAMLAAMRRASSLSEQTDRNGSGAAEPLEIGRFSCSSISFWSSAPASINVSAANAHVSTIYDGVTTWAATTPHQMSTPPQNINRIGPRKWRDAVARANIRNRQHWLEANRPELMYRPPQNNSQATIWLFYPPVYWAFLGGLSDLGSAVLVYAAMRWA